MTRKEARAERERARLAEKGADVAAPAEATTAQRRPLAQRGDELVAAMRKSAEKEKAEPFKIGRRRPLMERAGESAASVATAAMARVTRLTKLETRLQLPSGYVVGLRDTGSDYEFVLKLAVLAEATTTQALVSTLHSPKSLRFFEKQSQSSKLGLCVDLDLLTAPERDILDCLSMTRNGFAHKIHNLERTLAQYVDELPGNDKSRMVNRFWLLSGGGGMKPESDFSWLPPIFRSMLFEASVLPLYSLATKDEDAERKRNRRQWYSERLDSAEGIRTLSDLFAVSKQEVDKKTEDNPLFRLLMGDNTKRAA